jgi:hypothetical protein
LTDYTNYNELKEAYILVEQSRLKLWQALNPAIEPGEEFQMLQDTLIKTEEINGVIKITVDDILPRDVGLPKAPLKLHWLGMMHHALKNVDRRFDKVLCVIRVYSPASYWDVDNRAYKFIIDSLRYNKIIKDDRQKYLSFMVIGELDKVNPRTEIFIMEHPETINFIPD